MDLVEQLNRIFYPEAVAVVGASLNKEKVGFLCINNIVQGGYKGRIYPVNPSLDEAFGLRAYPSIRAIPGEVDLAVIVIPAEAAIAAVEDCVAKGVKGAILITSGFKEVGTEVGLDLEKRILDIASKGGVRIIGPNTIGMVNTSISLNATFHPGLGLAVGKTGAGSVAVATQSGGLCSYIVQTLTHQHVGISKAMGLGNRGDIDFEEILAYLGNDDETRVIVLYVEGLEQPRELMSIARQVVKRKPILALKGGRSEQLSGATLSHTGALAGKYEFYQAAFTQAGIIVADDVTELVDKTKALAMQPPAPGNRVALLSGSAGISIAMADSCQKLGLKLAEFSPDTWHGLRQLVSPLNSVDNPVDVAWTMADYDASLEVLKIVTGDDNVDAIAVSLAGAGTNAGITRAAIDMARDGEKPMTVCISPFSALIDEYEESGIPTYHVPDRAITALSGLVRYGEILRAFG